MAEKKENKLLDRLRMRYRILIYRSQTYDEVWHKNTSKLSIISYFVFFLLVYTLLVMALVMFTPLNRLLPAYRDSELQQQIIDNSIRADSLEYELHVRDQYLKNIKQIISGEVPDNYQAGLDSSSAYEEINFTENTQDSLLRKELENDVQASARRNGGDINRSLRNVHMYTPVNGMVVNSFDASKAHYGIDIVSEVDESVLAVLDGTVISADWTLETGYVIRVQHKNDLISGYKHNSVLLKDAGDQVRAGETIAIIGNTGEITTGPHLHFELWYKGKAVNPENFVTF